MDTIIVDPTHIDMMEQALVMTTHATMMIVQEKT
jgi:hypothetical protein